MSKLVHNYTANGSSTTDEYGTHLVLNRLLQGDVVEGFAVVANGTPNMTVLVQPGSGRIATGTYPASYGYLISHDTSAGEVVTIATSAASPRIDYVVAYVDKSVAGSTSGVYVNNTNNVLKFASVAGTPAGSPVAPTTTQIQAVTGAANPYIILAQIAVAASVSSITNANITDLRNFTSILRTVKSFTNTGTLGGTFYYTNQGGVKRLYGQSAHLGPLFSSSAPTYTLILPPGFFTNITTVTPAVLDYGAVGESCGIPAYSTTSISISCYSPTNYNSTVSIEITGN